MRALGHDRRRLFALLAVCVAAACAAPLHAQQSAPPKATETPAVVDVTTDRADSVYRRGEEVTFIVTATRDGKPVDEEIPVRFRITNDGLTPPIAEGTLNLVGGQATVSSKLNVPGFLNCVITRQSKSNRYYSQSAAVAVDPLEIKPSLPVPDDFDAFWDEQKKLLAAIPLNVRLTPVESPLPEVECFDLQADGFNGPLSAYLARPKGAKPGSLSAIVIPHGAGVRSSGLSSAAKWAQTGFLALDFNANGLPNGKPDKFYADLGQGELRQYYLKGRESRETAFFRTLFLRVVRALDAVTSQAEWNGRTLVVHGVSQGGGQAIAAAGLDPRVTFFCAFVPAICDHTGSSTGRINGWPKLVPIDPKTGKPDEKTLQASRYFDCVNLAARAKAPALFTVGFVDATCPPSSVYAAYNAVPNEKQILHLPKTGHATTHESNQAALEAVLKHAESQSKKN